MHVSWAEALTTPYEVVARDLAILELEQTYGRKQDNPNENGRPVNGNIR